jgi:hypothetical protein
MEKKNLKTLLWKKKMTTKNEGKKISKKKPQKIQTNPLELKKKLKIVLFHT